MAHASGGAHAAGQELPDSWLGHRILLYVTCHSPTDDTGLICTVNSGFQGQQDRAASNVKCCSSLCQDHICYPPVDRRQASEH